jgi:hypothetical protein
MSDGKITADTLAKIINEIAEANKKSPGTGVLLFDSNLEKMKLLRSGALNEAVD